MKSRKLIVLISMITGIAVIAIFLFAMSQSAFAGNFFAFNSGQPASAARDGVTILARRLTSIPFGIQDDLVLSNNGQVVTVQGHGDCPAGGEYFQLKVTVQQDGLNGLAVGHTEAQCVPGTQVPWQMEVSAPGPKAFAEGEALACGHAVIHTEDGGTIVYDWCKNVALQ